LSAARARYNVVVKLSGRALFPRAVTATSCFVIRLFFIFFPRRVPSRNESGRARCARWPFVGSSIFPLLPRVDISAKRITLHLAFTILWQLRFRSRDVYAQPSEYLHLLLWGGEGEDTNFFSGSKCTSQILVIFKSGESLIFVVFFFFFFFFLILCRIHLESIFV
jgi:hypothetical protein